MSLEILLARSAGFCFGVKKAIEKAETLDGEVPIFGYLIHNPQEVERLRAKGKRNVHELSDVGSGRVVVTAHGLDIHKLDSLKDGQREVIDTTCPLVTRIYREGWKMQDKGARVVIIGDPDHVEVKGIASRMKDPIIVYHEEDLERVPTDRPIGIICQSTLLMEKWKKFTHLLTSRCRVVDAVDTICKPTKDRQSAAEELAQSVDVMLVVGGYNSSNTSKLREVCARYLGEARTHHIERPEEIVPDWFSDDMRVGVTAGASTPDYVIQAVIERVRALDPVSVVE